MGNPRRQPKLLSAKLLAIREFLNVGQADMASKLQFEILSHSRRQYRIEPARVSEYEKGKREPNLFVMIAYVRLGHVHMETVVDDDVIVDQFRTRLGKEFDYSRAAKNKSNKPAIPLTRLAKTSPERLGDFVRRIRTEKGLSPADVSKRSAVFGARIAASDINRIERNHKLSPMPDRLRALAHGLGLPVDELFARAASTMRPDEADELRLLARYRELSAKRKADFRKIIEILALG
jgi:transcriptional regulator with XRE-family HTH domain